MHQNVIADISSLRHQRVSRNGCAALLGYKDQDYSVIKAAIQDDLGLKLTICDDWGKVTERLEFLATRMDFAIFDLSRMTDPDDIVSFGFELRRRVPRLPVIFMLEDIQRDDLSCERSAICDATLKLPLRKATLLLGIDAAIYNRDHVLSCRPWERLRAVR
ncbi:MAG: hypothetical protein KGK00_04225 [Paracoccaceae bacterium]|nr:hypothetical protein [Paracoccaceae bacterium]